LSARADLGQRQQPVAHGRAQLLRRPAGAPRRRHPDRRHRHQRSRPDPEHHPAQPHQQRLGRRHQLLRPGEQPGPRLPRRLRPGQYDRHGRGGERQR
ncbi:hypothetical protein LTR94_036463, partial [Friedmanniomyces endolithicus]